MKIKEFPHEVLIKIDNEPYYIGRITVDRIGQNFTSEISIIHAESKKIYHAVGNLYQYDDVDEIVESSVQKLSNYLRNIKD